MEVLPVTNQFNVGFNSEKAWSGWSQSALAARLERELRAAKGGSAFAAAEVLVPGELLSRAARRVLLLAEEEPCGVRGAALIVHLHSHTLAAFKIHPDMLTTHEIHLHLQHDDTNWTSMLPQFLKNLTRGGTIMISPSFEVTKKRLFRSETE